MNKLFILVMLLIITMTTVQARDEVYVYNFGEISRINVDQYALLTNPFTSPSYKLEILYNNRVCIDLDKIEND